MLEGEKSRERLKKRSSVHQEIGWSSWFSITLIEIIQSPTSREEAEQAGVCTKFRVQSAAAGEVGQGGAFPKDEIYRHGTQFSFDRGSRRWRWRRIHDDMSLLMLNPPLEVFGGSVRFQSIHRYHCWSRLSSYFSHLTSYWLYLKLVRGF